jgi:hypothetical protein
MAWYDTGKPTAWQWDGNSTPATWQWDGNNTNFSGLPQTSAEQASN